MAAFALDGREVDLVPNENGNMLHGGPVGFGRRPWSLLGHGASAAHLGLVSEDGDMGFPGRLFATCSYELLEPATLRVTLQAFADAPTPVNLTAHNYFNLDGSSDARDHLPRGRGGSLHAGQRGADPDGRDPFRRRHAASISARRVRSGGGRDL